MIQPWPLLLIPLLAVLRTATGASVPISIDVIPGTTSSSPSVAQFSSLSSGFDAPKVKSLNSTSFDWWYFDVVSSDLDYSLVVVFFTADATGLWTGTTDVGTADYVAISVTSTDGALFNVGVLAEELTVVTIGDGSSGILDGTLTGWTGSPDMSQYEILVDDPVSGLQGTVSFQSVRRITAQFVVDNSLIYRRLHLLIFHALLQRHLQDNLSTSGITSNLGG